MNLWGIFYFSYLNTVNFIINKTPFYKFRYLNMSISFQPGKEKVFWIFQMEWLVRTMLKQNCTRELVANMLEGLKEQNKIEVSAQTQNSWLFLNWHCQGAGTQSLSCHTLAESAGHGAHSPTDSAGPTTDAAHPPPLHSTQVTLLLHIHS